jgi:hypothetical protein
MANVFQDQVNATGGLASLLAVVVIVITMGLMA